VAVVESGGGGVAAARGRQGGVAMGEREGGRIWLPENLEKKNGTWVIGL